MWQQLKQGSLIYLTLAYLALPMPLFLFGWLRPVYALPLAALLLGLLLLWGRDIKAIDRPTVRLGGMSLAVCAVVALVWVAASGAGGIAYQNADYIKHNAIIKALSYSQWPVVFDDGSRLAYPLGYYLPGAAVGKLFGWTAAHCAIFLWTWAGAALSLLWFVHLAGGGYNTNAPCGWPRCSPCSAAWTSS